MNRSGLLKQGSLRMKAQTSLVMLAMLPLVMTADKVTAEDGSGLEDGMHLAPIAPCASVDSHLSGVPLFTPPVGSYVDW